MSDDAKVLVTVHDFDRVVVDDAAFSRWFDDNEKMTEKMTSR